MQPARKRLGFFSRLLDDTDAGERYRLASDQIVHAEALGFASAWVAQHHFNADEGGLPSPFVFLAQVAARTTRIRLGTGVVTLVLEDHVRVAEDAAVLDLLSGSRLELGLSAGGTPSTFPPFGVDFAERQAIFERKYAGLLAIWRGEEIAGANRVYPLAPGLADGLWHGTFSPEGGRRAGNAGDGLMLSRTQPRPSETPNASLAAIQDPIIDAYLNALPPGRAPRILASRSVFVADCRDDAMRFAEIGLARYVARLRREGRPAAASSLADMIAAFDVHLGTVQDVIESLSQDRVLDRATDVAVQVHSVDPPHPFILRSLELVTREVAPALGWAVQDPAVASAGRTT